jgi:hypothetical protein
LPQSTAPQRQSKRGHFVPGIVAHAKRTDAPHPIRSERIACTCSSGEKLFRNRGKNPTFTTAVFRGENESVNSSMRKLSTYGIWAGAALYATIGVLGLLFLTTQPNIAAPADGYGTARIPPNQ